jgi:hypothetical protein
MSMATTGSFQTVLAGSAGDAVLTKFDTSGVRVWSTYYGGSEFDYGLVRVALNSNVVYLAGTTESADLPMPATAPQNNFEGVSDGFIVKFDSSGARLAATFWGGPGGEGVGCYLDSLDRIYIFGVTSSTTGISTSGSFQPQHAGIIDIFLGRLDASLNTEWATYFGGAEIDRINDFALNGSKIVISGTTYSPTGIATRGAYQPTFGGGASQDAFLARFDTSGSRIWGTYFGTSGIEEGRTSLMTDSGFIDLFVAKSSGSQAVKFDTAGTHYWDYPYPAVPSDCLESTNGNIIVCGQVLAAISGLATPGAHQTTIGGGYDGFLGEITPSGVWSWGTYYGAPVAKP